MKKHRHGEPDTSMTVSEAGRKGGQVPRPGERNGNAKLTAGQVTEVLGWRGHASAKKVGSWYGISHWHVWAIWRGRYWSHLPARGGGDEPEG